LSIQYRGQLFPVLNFCELPDIDEVIIEDCKRNKRSAQEKLYQLFYRYAMSISLPYSNNEDEAMEVVNDGFIKVFMNIGNYDKGRSFKVWFRRILINTAIDNFRHNKNHYFLMDSEDHSISSFDDDVIDVMSADEILNLVQELPPAYKMVFNLYALEGYKHNEIADMLKISIGTSKSNLAKARKKLKTAIQTLNAKGE
jgi:RNA polymerase sigma factor (sigma-70 family)